MKKFLSTTFGFGLAIWFMTAIYLSVHSVINIFTDTDPYIAKTIFAGSFLTITSIGIYNKITGGEFTYLNDIASLSKGVEADLKIKQGGCKSCKNKKK